jgi:hypothetical protein
MFWRMLEILFAHVLEIEPTFGGLGACICSWAILQQSIYGHMFVGNSRTLSVSGHMFVGNSRTLSGSGHMFVGNSRTLSVSGLCLWAILQHRQYLDNTA